MKPSQSITIERVSSVVSRIFRKIDCRDRRCPLDQQATYPPTPRGFFPPRSLRWPSPIPSQDPHPLLPAVRQDNVPGPARRCAGPGAFCLVFLCGTREGMSHHWGERILMDFTYSNKYTNLFRDGYMWQILLGVKHRDCLQ